MRQSKSFQARDWQLPLHRGKYPLLLSNKINFIRRKKNCLFKRQWNVISNKTETENENEKENKKENKTVKENKNKKENKNEKEK